MMEPAAPASPPLFDMHCHLGFAPDEPAIVAGFAACGGGAFSCGVDPADYLRERDLVEGVAPGASAGAVRVGLGLHPWWVSRVGAPGLELVEALLPDAPYVGEVGLDFGARHGGDAQAQLAAFRRMCALLAKHGGKAVSVHAVRSVDAVLDCLEEAGALADNTVILHWFSGTSQQLTRALRAGCLVSLGELSLETKRAQAYARAAAAQGRLLLETDWPPEGDQPRGFDAFYAHLEHGARLLADACGDEVLQAACETSRRLLALN